MFILYFGINWFIYGNRYSVFFFFGCYLLSLLKFVIIRMLNGFSRRGKFLVIIGCIDSDILGLNVIF